MNGRAVIFQIPSRGRGRYLHYFGDAVDGKPVFGPRSVAAVVTMVFGVAAAARDRGVPASTGGGRVVGRSARRRARGRGAPPRVRRLTIRVSASHDRMSGDAIGVCGSTGGGLLLPTAAVYNIIMNPRTHTGRTRIHTYYIIYSHVMLTRRRQYARTHTRTLPQRTHV